MRSMRRSSGDQSLQSLQLTTQMSNLGPNRHEGESAGLAAMHALTLPVVSDQESENRLDI